MGRYLDQEKFAFWLAISQDNANKPASDTSGSNYAVGPLLKWPSHRDRPTLLRAQVTLSHTCVIAAFSEYSVIATLLDHTVTTTLRHVCADRARNHLDTRQQRDRHAVRPCHRDKPVVGTSKFVVDQRCGERVKTASIILHLLQALPKSSRLGNDT